MFCLTSNVSKPQDLNKAHTAGAWLNWDDVHVARPHQTRGDPLHMIDMGSV